MQLFAVIVNNNSRHKTTRLAWRWRKASIDAGYEN